MKKQQPAVYLIVVAISWLTCPVVCLPLPVTYDQRQEGQFNLHAQLENVVVVLIPAVALPELVHHLTEAVPFKAGLPTLLLKASPSKTTIKDKATEIDQRDGQKHFDTLPNFPGFRVSDLPTDPNEQDSSPTNMQDSAGSESTSESSHPEKLNVQKEDTSVSDSNSSLILVAESPALVMQQRSNE
uniref:Uncharacterized protein n=1 Tax=Rhodnius prolixus TaxID=13249 RepID=T1I7S2_RHOPR